MSRWRKAWPVRLVSTVTALALAFACTFGLYDHAAGHHRYHTTQQVAQGVGEHGSCHKEAGQVHATHAHVGHAYVGHDHARPGPAGHDGGDADMSADCCGMLCHGGHAILVAAAMIPDPVLGSPIAQPATALHSAPPSGLERPPKPSVSA